MLYEWLRNMVYAVYEEIRDSLDTRKENKLENFLESARYELFGCHDPKRRKELLTEIADLEAELKKLRDYR